MNKRLSVIVFSVLFLAVYSQELPPQLLDEINDPNQIIHILNETSIDTTLLDQVKNLNIAKEDPANVVDEVPATDGISIDNTDDFKTTDYIDNFEDVEAYEPLVHSSEEDNEIQQYRSHIATAPDGEDVVQLYESSVKFAPEEGENDLITQVYESSVKFDPEEGEDDQITHLFESSVKFAPEEGEEDQVPQVYQSPIAVAPPEDETNDIGAPIDNVDDFRTIDYTEEPSEKAAEVEEVGEYTQGQLIDNLDDFRTIDNLDATDPDVINNAEQKLEGEAESTPGVEIPPAHNDRGDEVEEESTGELDNTKYDTIDVQEKGFLPNN